MRYCSLILCHHARAIALGRTLATLRPAEAAQIQAILGERCDGSPHQA
jgi:hypothetical protein